MLFQTSDGSHSIQSEQYKVSYHSIHGAIQETQHVFLNAALFPKAEEKTTLHILGIGFGTGLNAYMTYLEAKAKKLTIHYTAVEAFPLDLETAKQLNYPTLLHQPSHDFLQFHEANWNNTTELTPNFTLTKVLKKFEDLDFNNVFDIIYFDAFAPTAQPELWEAPVLQRMYDALKKGGFLTTYCAKGVVKRTLKAIGFTIEALPGPPRKREMTRATK